MFFCGYGNHPLEMPWFTFDVELHIGGFAKRVHNLTRKRNKEKNELALQRTFTWIYSRALDVLNISQELSCGILMLHSQQAWKREVKRPLPMKSICIYVNVRICAFRASKFKILAFTPRYTSFSVRTKRLANE